ncbi:MAG: hypothetical protein ALECFALPRED_008836 [Alectoria fallacina]|uniref:Uncharacterized protein n=1 Tax=Alectoria fallacina TaxID=1903189 RepID=A0A8H3EXA5_9LECA|nr:MAG: hypothetical protein ALECFALPRED_008836 [Alectoria fallacina]
MLPLELVIAIADQLETGHQILSLARTCKTYYGMLVGRPWKDICIQFRPIPYCLEGGLKSATECRVIRDGAVQIISPWQMTRTRHRQCPMSPCEACEIDVALRFANAYLDSRARKISASLRELTLSGWLPQTLLSVNEDAPGHSFKGARGVCGLRPEVLNVELEWESWSPIMLSSFDLTRLRSLKMPVRAPLDCSKIGAAFLDMPHLASLTITELSDSQEFVDEFRHLGDGIIALSSSLRSLDITITNSDRLGRWEQGEPFVQPDDVAFFFNGFFPEPSCSQTEALVRARFNDPREPLDVNTIQSSKGPLNLESIRLKHIGLPWWAFETVFSPHTIQELDLPRCRMAPEIWDVLKRHAQLHRLANINYEILSASFIKFLSTQNSLQFLSFARPPDIYSEVGISPNVLGPRSNLTSFVVTEPAPHLGPGTEWGRTHARNAWLIQSTKSWTQYEHLIQSPRSWSYFENLIGSLSSYADYQYPKKSTFVKALSKKTWLKHLVLPADMFDITPEFMACLARELPALESIEWGFDYACPRLCACFLNDFLPSHPHLKKITFLSLNRPLPLSNFDAKHMHLVLASGSYGLTPGSIKYVRYRDLNSKSYKGEFSKSEIYYHRENMVDSTWWLRIPATQGEGMFEYARTPNISTIEKAGSKAKRLRHIESDGS